MKLRNPHKIRKIKFIIGRYLRAFFLYSTIVFSVILTPVRFLLKKIGWRILNHHYLFGHLASEPDALIKDRIMGNVPRYKMIIFPTFCSVASSSLGRLQRGINKYLLQLWKQQFYVVTNPWMAIFLRPILYSPRVLSFPMILRRPFIQDPDSSELLEAKGLGLFLSKEYYADSMEGSYFTVSRDFFKNRPLNTTSTISVPIEDVERGWAILKRKWGIQRNDWFVCFHARDSSYHEGSYESEACIRNVSNIETYGLALKEVSDRGGWCIRLGSNKTSPLPSSLQQIPRVIDYSKSDATSDFMDVFLLSSCRFLIGSVSGPQLVAGVFGVPSVVTNIIPLAGYPLFPFDLGIFKLLYSETESRLLTFEEMFQGIGRQTTLTLKDCSNAKVRIVDSSEEDILEVVKQMFNRPDFLSDPHYPDYEKLQRDFMSRTPKHRWSNGPAKVGYQFLKKYSHLLCPEKESKLFSSAGSNK